MKILIWPRCVLHKMPRYLFLYYKISFIFRLESDTDNNEHEQYEAPAGLILPEATKSLAAQVLEDIINLGSFQINLDHFLGKKKRP